MQYKNMLEHAYKRNDINDFINIVDNYIKKLNHFNYDIVFNYVELFIQDRKYDEACKVLKILESKIYKYDIVKKICILYFYAYNSKEAERIYFNKFYPINDTCLLVEIYLHEGKINKANKVVTYALKNGINNYKKLLILKNKIDNYYKYNSFIETDYSSFKENGCKLQKGHIVYLKNSPNRVIYGDYKSDKRPYLIWKIEKENVYMFPLTTKCKEKSYVIYKKKYPNNDEDVTLISNMCQTTTDNILSVYSKLSNNDFEKIIKTMFNSIYFGYRSKINENKDFINYYVGEPQIGNIVEYISVDNKEKKYYFIIEITDVDYKVVEVDIENNVLVSNNIKKIKKSKAIHNIINISKECSNGYLKKIAEIKKEGNLSWRKISFQGINYIVLMENDNVCYCINQLYSSSYIECCEIDKSKIDTIGEKLTKDEIMYIRKILIHSDINKVFKKKIKIKLNL